jgi:hypothetical protein
MSDKPKRPRDANQLAKSIVDIATGEDREKEKAKGQVKGGEIGGRRRAEVLTPEQRSDIARAAAQARWKKGD